MQQYSTGELTAAVSGKISGRPDILFNSISIDSRTISHFSPSVFFAIRGRNRDGHIFIPELIRKGINVFVVFKSFDIADFPDGIVFISVPDTLVALQQFGSYIRMKYAGKLVGITGSNGKTIVKEWLYQVLRNYLPVFRSPLSYNSQLGVPLSLALLENVYKISIIEAGISYPGEMEKLEQIIKPEIGLITNLGEAHQKNFSSYEEKLKEKLKLFKNCKTIVYCRDHQLIHDAVTSFLPQSVRKVSWGTSADTDYRITAVDQDKSRTVVSIESLGEKIIIPFTDKASVENAIHVLILSLVLDAPENMIITSLSKLEPVEMRLGLLKGLNSCTLINDSYNSDIQSVKNSLDLLAQQNQHKEKMVILSDIQQSGKSDKEMYEELGSLIKQKNIDRFIGIGPSVESFREYFHKNSLFYPDTKAFIISGIWTGFSNMAILIKGSRAFEFENITAVLQEQQHQTILEINLTSLISNLNSFRSLLKPSTRIMAMVKAFSYGSGSYEIANKLQFHKVDYLATAYVDEGVELRKKGISLPVMVMNPDPSSFWTLVDNKLEPEIFSRDLLVAFLRFADNNGLKSYPVHIKLDTGMHRLGFNKNEIGELLKLIPSGLVEIVSVFSHLAASGEPEHDDFTRKQIGEYKDLCDAIREKCGRGFMMHILSSAGVSRFPEAQFDMVRLGIGLYGVKIAESPDLVEISTFKTHVSQIKDIYTGETVGYGRAGKINSQGRIAVIPAGYADGIPRSLGNGVGRFIVNNKPSPVVGNVCMDMCMLDITGIEVKEGDEVIIFGRRNPVQELARAAGTIPYEILTGISGRVKRVYLEE